MLKILVLVEFPSSLTMTITFTNFIKTISILILHPSWG